MTSKRARQAKRIQEKNSYKTRFSKAPEGNWRASYADSVVYGTDPRDEAEDPNNSPEIAPPPFVLDDCINWRTSDPVSYNNFFKKYPAFHKKNQNNKARFYGQKRISVDNAFKSLNNSISEVRVTVANCTHSTNELKVSVDKLNEKLNNLKIRNPAQQEKNISNEQQRLKSMHRKVTKLSEVSSEDQNPQKGNKIILSTRKIISDKDIIDFRLKVSEYLNTVGVSQTYIDQIKIKKFRNRKSAILTIENDEEYKKIKRDILKKIRKNNKILKAKKEILLENKKILSVLPFSRYSDDEFLPTIVEEDSNNNLVVVKTSPMQMVAREYYSKKIKPSDSPECKVCL